MGAAKVGAKTTNELLSLLIGQVCYDPPLAVGIKEEMKTVDISTCSGKSHELSVHIREFILQGNVQVLTLNSAIFNWLEGCLACSHDSGIVISILVKISTRSWYWQGRQRR